MINSSHGIAVEIRSQLREALVHPGILIAINRPVDHVLELVGQDALVRICARLQSVRVDVEHLSLIRVGVSQPGVLIGVQVVSIYRGPQSTGLEYVNVGVIIYSRRPLASEELAVGGIDVAFEPLGRSFQGLLIETGTFLHPQVEVRRHVAKGGRDSIVSCSIYVCHPKDVFIAHGIVRWSVVYHQGDGLIQLLQASGERHQVPLRD